MTRCELGSRPKIPLMVMHNSFNTIPSHGVEAMCGPERLPSPDCRVPCGARDRGKWGSVCGSPVWSRDYHGICRGAKVRKARICERMRSRPHFWARSQLNNSRSENFRALRSTGMSFRSRARPYKYGRRRSGVVSGHGVEIRGPGMTRNGRDPNTLDFNTRDHTHHPRSSHPTI
jgi:hypothetical protein